MNKLFIISSNFITTVVGQPDVQYRIWTGNCEGNAEIPTKLRQTARRLILDLIPVSRQINIPLFRSLNFQ